MKNQTKLLSFLFFVIIWQALSIFINSELFPSVINIIISLAKHIIDGELLPHLLITLYRVFVAFFITMFIGLIFGMIMGLSRRFNDMFDFLLIVGLNIPALVTIIICYIWFGLTDLSAILAVIINKIPVVIVNIREGARAIEKKYIDLAKVYKVPKEDLIKKIYLPQMYPYILATTRLVLSLIWKIVLVVELLGRSDGVGFQISVYFQFFDITSIFAYSLAFILVILLIESILLRPFEKRIERWK
ncbi:MAG: ABC transporter permease [Arcobacter sp.]|nr:MAG: ABC transporter permease [Arcobacter sp.]